MTVNRSSKIAKRIVANAHNVMVYSLSNCFEAKPMVETPVYMGQDGQIEHLTQSEALSRHLAGHGSKLLDNGNGTFTVHVHSNLWYEFGCHDFSLTADDMLECACGFKKSL